MLQAESMQAVHLGGACDWQDSQTTGRHVVP